MFAGRIIFIRYFSLEYLGINGLFSNILNVLSLAELGIGSAMIYSMYQPIASGNEEEICRLMNLYRSLYHKVAFFVAFAGLLLLPFLKYLVKEPPQIAYLNVIYLMYLANTVSTYFFSYKQSLIMANQKAYINMAYIQGFKLIQTIAQIWFMIATRNYFCYLGIQILCSILTNLTLSRKADRMYPFLKTERKELPSIEDRGKIFKNIRALSMHRIGTVVIYNTDNLIISAFIGLATVGIYSNYKLVLSNMKNLLTHVHSSFSASIGNLVVSRDKETIYEIYEALNFLMFSIYGYCSSGIFLLINPFIRLCFGSQYLFSETVVFLMCLDFYLTGMRQITLRFREAYGIFYQDRYKPLAESVLNLIMSLALVGNYGISGVLIGTIFSNLMTNFWVEPMMLMKYGLADHWKKRLRCYFKKYIGYTAVMLIAGTIAFFAIRTVGGDGIGNFIVKGIVMTVVYGSVFVAIFFRTKEFHFLLKRVIGLLHR